MMKKNVVIILLATVPVICQAQWNRLENKHAFTGTSLSYESTKGISLSDPMGRISTLKYTQNDQAHVNDVFDHNQTYQSLRFTNADSTGINSARYFAGEFSDGEQHVSTVFQKNKWLFGFSAGRGDNYVKAQQSFTGVNPYLIHGGSATGFRYYGANAGVQLTSNALVYFGGTTISANQLEDRNAYYSGIQTKHLSTTLMNFSRGGESIGKGINFATSIGRTQFNYRQISRNNGAHTKTLEFNLPLNSVPSGRLGFGVESINNPLYRDQDDMRFMFTFSGEWGKRRSGFNLDEPASEDQGLSGRKMVFIGAGVVAGALIASSGSSTKDEATNITAAGQHEAAKRILNEVNPASVRENREYGGLIYRNPDGSYANTSPVKGNNDSVNIPNTAPAGTQVTAVFHTHAAFDSRYDNENFSSTDINTARRNNLDSYLGTPAGAFKFFDVSSGDITQLGTIAN